MNTQCRLLLTRPKVKADAFARALESAAPGRFVCTIAPVMEIVPLAASLTTSGVQGVLFTSANAVGLAAEMADLSSLPCLCVGPATTRAAEAHGLPAINAGGDAGDVLRKAGELFRPGAGRLLHLRGVHMARDIASELTAQGLETQSVVIYDQRPLPLAETVTEGLMEGRFDGIAFFSPRSAEIFAGLAERGWSLGETAAFCLSPSVAKNVQNLPFYRVLVAETPNSETMIACLTASDCRTSERQ